MAVTVTDTRKVIDQADTTTGWEPGGSTAVFTTAPDPVETTGNIGVQVSNTTVNTFFVSGSASNLSNTLFYAWALPGGVLDTRANGGVGVILGDGTNNGAYFRGGSDAAAFRHGQGPVFWQCYLIDTGRLGGFPSASIAGTAASTNFGAITQFGIRFKTLAKSVGGQENCFVDILRYGNGGIVITGGVSGSDPGIFSEIAAADRSTANLQAFGIFRELGTGLYGVQGPLTFGDGTGTGTTEFYDTNQAVVWEDRNIGTDKYHLTITGNATNPTNFVLGTRGGEGAGSAGCTLTVPPGVGAYLSASNANVDRFALYGCTVSGFNRGIRLSRDATNAPNHEIFATAFSGNGVIEIGLTEFKNNTINASTSTSASIIESTTNVSDLAYSSAGTGHAIVVRNAGSYTFTDFTYTGYATVDGSTGNEVFYNESGGSVTINVVGGDTPTVRNSAGSTTTINQNVSVTLTGMQENTEVRVMSGSTFPQTELAGTEIATNGTSGSREFTFSLQAGTLVDVVIHSVSYVSQRIENFTIPGSNTSIPIQQRFDRNYLNP